MPSNVPRKGTRFVVNGTKLAAWGACRCGRRGCLLKRVLPVIGNIGIGSDLLVVRTPGTFSDANSLARSRAVIRHDRLARASCLGIALGSNASRCTMWCQFAYSPIQKTISRIRKLPCAEAMYIGLITALSG